jgi:hypothetical protein
LIILDDNEPELDQELVVVLSLDAGSGRVSADNSSAQILIFANDNILGVFGFAISEISIDESSSNVSVPVLRNEGYAGSVRLYYSVRMLEIGDAVAQRYSMQ